MNAICGQRAELLIIKARDTYIYRLGFEVLTS
jgi:hypothetical protein